MLRKSDPDVFFIHVPKCGGTTVSQSLRPHLAFPVEEMAADLGLPASQMPPHDYNLRHPELGRIKVNHIPAAILAEHFPRTWAAVEASSSFAVLRDPRDRFVSAVLQRLREYRGLGASAVSDRRVEDEAARVCEWLDGRGPFCDAEYVHFSRQADYVERQGRRVHERVFPIERLDALYDWLHERHGLPRLRPEPKRVGRRPRGWMRHVHPVASFAGRRLLGRRARAALYPLWLRSGAFENTSSGYGRIAFDAGVEAFVARHYARDGELHREALERCGEAPAATGGDRREADPPRRRRGPARSR